MNKRLDVGMDNPRLVHSSECIGQRCKQRDAFGQWSLGCTALGIHSAAFDKILFDKIGCAAQFPIQNRQQAAYRAFLHQA